MRVASFLTPLLAVPIAQASVTSMVGFLIVVDLLFVSGSGSFVYDPDYKVRVNSLHRGSVSCLTSLLSLRRTGLGK